MSKQPTCKQCGKKITAEEKKVHNNKTFCEICYKKILSESEQYKKLISEVYRMATASQQQFNPLIYRQIKEYKENYGFEYSGILYTLQYIENILNKPMDFENYGIALVPYEYINAKKWWEITNKVCTSTKDVHRNIVTVSTFDKVNVNVQTTNLDTLLQLKGG